jgi:uncharacterized protein (TIGR03435 family)
MSGMATQVGGTPHYVHATGQVSMTAATLEAIVRRAFDLKAYQIIGPSWLSTERYDIVAKLPEGSTPEQIPLMLQSLLAERFSFQASHEMRHLPVYQLSVSKGGAHLQPATGESSVRAGGSGPVRRIHGQINIPNLISFISASLDRPIVDDTGLDPSINYQIDIEWSPDGVASAGQHAGADDPGRPDLFSALQRELGLRLEPKHYPVDVLVIEHVDRVPTAN